MTYRDAAGKAPEEAAPPGPTAPFAWDTVEGRCVACGAKPFNTTHRATARDGNRAITVACSSRVDGKGCGAEWTADSYAVWQERQTKQAEPVPWWRFW